MKRLSKQQKEINCLTQSNHILQNENNKLRLQLAKLSAVIDTKDDYSPNFKDYILEPEYFPFYSLFQHFTITLDLNTMPHFKTMSSLEVGDYLYNLFIAYDKKYKNIKHYHYFCLEHTKIGTPHFHGFSTLTQESLLQFKEKFTTNPNNPLTITFGKRRYMDWKWHEYVNKPCPYELPKYYALIKCPAFENYDEIDETRGQREVYIPNDPKFPPTKDKDIITTFHEIGKELQKCPTCKYNYI